MWGSRKTSWDGPANKKKKKKIKINEKEAEVGLFFLKKLCMDGLKVKNCRNNLRGYFYQRPRQLLLISRKFGI